MPLPIAIPIAAAALQTLGLISDFLGSRKSASAAKKAARKEAQAEGEVTIERIRQLEIEERALAGATRAGYAGSGVKADVGAPLAILAEQAKEFAFEKQITARVGATKAAAALQRGRDVGNAVRYQSYSNLARGASNIFTILSQSGKSSTGKSFYGPPT